MMWKNILNGQESYQLVIDNLYLNPVKQVTLEV